MNILLHHAGTCSGFVPPLANGRFVTLQGGTTSSSETIVGTVVEVACDDGCEQTRGLPYYACHVDGGQGAAAWTGDLFEDGASPRCEREYLSAYHSVQISTPKQPMC